MIASKLNNKTKHELFSVCKEGHWEGRSPTVNSAGEGSYRHSRVIIFKMGNTISMELLTCFKIMDCSSWLGEWLPGREAFENSLMGLITGRNH